MELNYPEHKHPHSIKNTEPNEHRIWVCEECGLFFTDDEMRKKDNLEFHTCKAYPIRKGQRCEAHREPYLPDLKLLEQK